MANPDCQLDGFWNLLRDMLLSISGRGLPERINWGDGTLPKGGLHLLMPGSAKKEERRGFACLLALTSCCRRCLSLLLLLLLLSFTDIRLQLQLLWLSTFTEDQQLSMKFPDLQYQIGTANVEHRTPTSFLTLPGCRWPLDYSPFTMEAIGVIFI